MKLKLKVLRPFTDKNDPKIHHEADDCLPMQTDTPDNIARINDLIARGLCAVASVKAEPEAPAAETVDKETEPAALTVAFGEQEYPLAAMKVALEAIGVSVSKNAGVPAVGKTLDALTEEQAAALQEVLAAKEE